MDAQVLGFHEALAVLAERTADVSAAEVETVPLLTSQGRILARELAADRDQPPFDRSTRDGFAVRAAELKDGVGLQVIGQLRAGEIWAGDPPPRHTTIEIMTGAPVPPWADAVVMVEHVERRGGEIHLAEGRVLREGENIVRRGSEACAGQIVLPARASLSAAEIALAASCGQTTLSVFRKPRIAIVATGDELVEIDQMPGPQQIRNSNSYALTALITATGGDAVRLPIAVDEIEVIRAALEAARQNDLIVLSGGVSMGKYDLVEEVLSSMGATFFFTGVRMQPGGPVVFGQLPATHEFPARFFFGLPGNPISTQVTFHVFVASMIRALCGADHCQPQFVQATLAEDVPGKPELTRLLPARLTGIEVQLVRWQGSGDLTANARANCYALLPSGREGFRAGEIIRILLQ